MAAKDDMPQPCNQEICNNGRVVFVTNTIRPQVLEQWVKSVAQKSEQRVDWHFVGGRAVVKTLGDVSKVRIAILELLPEHNRLQEKRHKELLPRHPYTPSFDLL